MKKALLYNIFFIVFFLTFSTYSLDAQPHRAPKLSSAISSKYQQVRYISFDIYRVKRGNKWGVINQTGEEIVPITYDYISDGRYNIGVFFARSGNKWGAFRIDGEILLPLEYSRIEWVSENNLILASKPNSYMLYDRTFNKMFPQEYDYFYLSLESKLFIVGLNSKFGLINFNGESISPLQYEQFIACRNGYCQMKLNGKLGFINLSNEVVIPFEYDELEYHAIGNTYVARKNNQWGVIDINNNVIVSFENNNTIERIISNPKQFIVSQSNKYGIIDYTGKVLVPPMYDTFVQNTTKNFYVVSRDEKYGFIDSLGKIIAPLIYDYAAGLWGGLAIVKRNNKYGAIDSSGKEVIPLIYDDYSGMSIKGLQVFKLGEYFGLVDNSGKIILPFEYKSVKTYSTPSASTPLKVRAKVYNMDDEEVIFDF